MRERKAVRGGIADVDSNRKRVSAYAPPNTSTHAGWVGVLGAMRITFRTAARTGCTGAGMVGQFSPSKESEHWTVELARSSAKKIRIGEESVRHKCLCNSLKP